MCRVLITGPCLDENQNISGISSLVRMIVSANADHHYSHFILGSKDSDKRGLGWFITQIMLVPRFIAFVMRHNIDVIHLNTCLNPAAIIRDYMLVCANTLFLRKKSMIHLHGGSMLMAPPGPHSPYFFMIRYMLKNQKLRIVLSDIEKDMIQKTYNMSCVAMPNAVAIAEEHTPKDFTGKLSLVFMGRIVKSKGIFLLADCLSELSAFFNQFDLTIYGTGPDTTDFLAKLSKIQGLRYQYKGVVKGASKDLALRQSHIFVLPSLYGEGLPVALLESMNNCCVPVVTDDASIGTVVRDGYNGYMAPKGYIQPLKNCLIKVFTERDKLYQLSANAKRTINESYNLTDYINKLNNLYKTFYRDETDKLLRDRLEPYNI